MDSTEKTIPRHVAIIMDGNGRWATQKGYIRTRGHREGAKRVDEIVIHGEARDRIEEPGCD